MGMRNVLRLRDQANRETSVVEGTILLADKCMHLASEKCMMAVAGMVGYNSYRV